MRVLVVSDVSSRMVGGVPAETLCLLRGLLESGCSVALASDVPLAGADAAAHFPISLPASPAMAADVERALREFRPDFVHVICMSSKGVLLLAPLLRAHRWALTVHSVPPYERKLNRWHGFERLHYGSRAVRFLPHSLAWRWVFRRARIPRVVVHSSFVQRIVVRYGYRPDRVAVIPLPFVVDEGASGRSAQLQHADAPLLLTVGGLAHTKGQHDVVKALPGLLARHPGLRYQMIGEVRDESYVAYLNELAKALGVADRVSITPSLSDQEKWAALARTDVYVQPSHEEGFCLALAEAAGIVPRWVGARTGAIAEMGEDDPGARVVPTRAPLDLGRAIAELLALRLPDTHMLQRCERLRRRFGLREYLEAHRQMYRDAQGSR